jgi:hypothetical protein
MSAEFDNVVDAVFQITSDISVAGAMTIAERTALDLLLGRLQDVNRNQIAHAETGSARRRR